MKPTGQAISVRSRTKSNGLHKNTESFSSIGASITY